MKNSDHGVFAPLASVQPLPEPARSIIEALGPRITPARLARFWKIAAQRTNDVVVVLENLADPHNVAAILRTCEAMGVQEVHLVRSLGPSLAARQVARRAEQWLTLCVHREIASCLSGLQQRGFHLFAATMRANDPPSVLRSAERCAIVLGNEHQGVSAKALELVERSYTIPMVGFVESLNVSVAAAVSVFAATTPRRPALSHSEQEELVARFLWQTRSGY